MIQTIGEAVPGILRPLSGYFFASRHNKDELNGLRSSKSESSKYGFLSCKEYLKSIMDPHTPGPTQFGEVKGEDETVDFLVTDGLLRSNVYVRSRTLATDKTIAPTIDLRVSPEEIKNVPDLGIYVMSGHCPSTGWTFLLGWTWAKNIKEANVPKTLKTPAHCMKLNDMFTLWSMREGLTVFRK